MCVRRHGRNSYCRARTREAPAPRRIVRALCYAPPVTTRPSKQLETFPNPRPGRDYHIAFECPEFTCLCPMTGQPDFATISIDYVPDQLCVELKSLKLYLWSYRDEGAFHEAVTNQICDDLVNAIAPRSAVVTGKFWVRGGITTTVVVRHHR
ncbi:MAG TPA: preQ(1) synthase [Kofleriaceae bacterium]|nr:preQ(1) synthase [Kofleriaceae bacterium]